MYKYKSFFEYKKSLVLKNALKKDIFIVYIIMESTNRENTVKKFLLDLNGPNNGYFRKFIDNFNGEPRIAWYPSAGTDFKSLIYLHPKYSEINPALGVDPAPPEMFLFTDYYLSYFLEFINKPLIFSDSRTSISIEHIEWLPNLNLPLHREVIVFSEGSAFTDKAVFLMIKIKSNIFGESTIPVIYAFAENEAFYCKKLAPTKVAISHIIHVRYGSGFGGGRASGVWLLHVLKKLNCEVFITDNHHQWQRGDLFTLNYCSEIPPRSDASLMPIRLIPGYRWSNHGNVTWNIVR